MREARWTQFVSVETGGVVGVYTTHLCVTVRSATDACDVDAQLASVDAILDHVDARAHASILGGDFNVFDDYEDGSVIQSLVARGLVDTLREVTAEPVITFEGLDWAPAGRIDYLFTTAPVIVRDASVADPSASDHRAVTARIEL